ncbi:MAG: hypothetical protein ABIO94_06005, partial [Opitutaceae bacterium]
TLLLISFLALQVPVIISDPSHGYQWTNPCKALALIGGALLLATGSAHRFMRSDLDRRIPSVGTLACLITFSGFLLLAGVQHFVYLDFVIQLVPSWMPGRTFWAYATGVALVAGGSGMLIPQTRRLAATLSGIMIFLWVILLHLPRAFFEANQTNEWGGVCEALALSGVAFLLAGSVSTKVRV